MLAASERVVGGETRIVWLPDDFVREHKVGEWLELPLWIADPQWRGLHKADVARALAAGLTFRPLHATVRGAFEHATPTTDAGLTPEREAGLIQGWLPRRRQRAPQRRGDPDRRTPTG
jgi:2'-hydroxyisoflavone reductase